MAKRLGSLLWFLTGSLLFVSAVDAQTTYFPARGIYNGFLGQMNIVECDNANDQAVDLLLTLTRSDGVVVAEHGIPLLGNGSVHTILNDLTDIRDSHGTYTLQLPKTQIFIGDKVSCRTAFYRPAHPLLGKQFEYAYVLPVQNPQLGSLSGVYNAIDPAGLSTLTHNWLSVINFDSRPLSASVFVYRVDGSLQKQVPIAALAPGARVDIPLGHPDGQVTGLYTIEPTDSSQLYDAFLVRYNSAKAGGFNFAFPLRASSGSCSGQALLASTMGNGLTDNWLEIANAGPSKVGVSVEVRDRAGKLLHGERREIPSYGQSHVYLSAIIDPARSGNVGSARVICDDPSDKLIVQSTFYGHKPDVSSVVWAYSTQVRDSSPVNSNATLNIPVNTFVGMSNWLKLADSSLQASAVDYSVYNQAGEVTAQGVEYVPGGGSSDISVHGLAGPDVIGSVVASTETPQAAFSGEVLRVMSDSDGDIGTIVSVPGIVQQKGRSGSSAQGFRGDPQSLAPYRDSITREEAVHLFTRTSFGGSQQEILLSVKEGLRKTVDRLTQIGATSTLDREALDWVDGSYQGEVADPEEIYYRDYGIRRAWLNYMLHSPYPLKEKMALVLHDLFATSCRVLGGSSMNRCWEHLSLLRSEALGNFRRLAKAMTVDYTMLVWLNGSSNVKERPDENYAREQWELFTLGEASKHDGLYPLYTSEDISQAARAFTGWTTQYIDGKYERVFVYDQHDFGTKCLWKNTPYETCGNFNHEDITDLTLDVRPEAARFIARRLFSAFIHDHPNHRVVNQLAALLVRSGFELKPLLTTLLRSEAAFSVEAKNNRIKDGLTYALGFLRSTGIPMRIDTLEYEVRDMGLSPLNPPAVNGWPINKYGKAAESEYFLAWASQYANFVTEAFRGLRYFDDPEEGNYSLRALLEGIGSENPRSDEVVAHLLKIMNVSLSNEERQHLIDYLDNSYNIYTEEMSPDLFDARRDSHIRYRIAGVLWILSQMEDYLVH